MVLILQSKIPVHEPLSGFYTINKPDFAWLIKIIMSENMAEISFYSKVSIVFPSMAH